MAELLVVLSDTNIDVLRTVGEILWTSRKHDMAIVRVPNAQRERLEHLPNVVGVEEERIGTFAV